MNKIIVATIVLIFSIQECDNNAKTGLCTVDREERILIENSFERHGGGVFVFNEKYLLDFKEVELGYEREELSSKILRNNPSIIKDSNTVEILLFSEGDSVWIREEDMFSKDRVFMKVCYNE